MVNILILGVLINKGGGATFPAERCALFHGRLSNYQRILSLPLSLQNSRCQP